MAESAIAQGMLNPQTRMRQEQEEEKRRREADQTMQTVIGALVANETAELGIKQQKGMMAGAVMNANPKAGMDARESDQNEELKDSDLEARRAARQARKLADEPTEAAKDDNPEPTL